MVDGVFSLLVLNGTWTRPGRRGGAMVAFFFVDIAIIRSTKPSLRAYSNQILPAQATGLTPPLYTNGKGVLMSVNETEQYIAVTSMV